MPNRSHQHTRGNVLLTGFDPFGGETLNPSWEAVRVLEGERIAGRRIDTRQLPTSFARAPAALLDSMADIEPEVVVCVGQAGGRSRISLERIAINVCDARIPDNDGACPRDAHIVANGPDGLFSTLPLQACMGSLHHAGIPAEISNSAGTYVCNQVMYVLLHALQGHPHARGGFVHIPYSPQQAIRHRDAPSMSLDQVSGALRLIVRAALESVSASTHAAVPSGREH